MTEPMTPAEGLARLTFHAMPEPGAFLEMLRPYRGVDDAVLADLSRALRACAPLFTGDPIPRELMSAAWAIAHLGRVWALAPEGMLRRHSLITDADQARLAAFLDRFDEAVFWLLEGGPENALAAWPDAR